jgi:hypothetical protein
MKLPVVIVFMASVASVAYATDPLAGDGASTLSTAYLGTDYLDMTGSPSYLIGCGSLGCGGEFQGMIDTNGTTSNPTPPFSSSFISANFFCVDSQEDFSWGTQGYADVVPLAQIDTNGSMVRYSNVSNTNPPTWTYTPSNTSPSIALPSDAQLRYAMAAWLISQYEGPGVGGNYSGSDLDATSDSILQEAVWDLTSNSLNPSNPDFAPPQSNTAVWNDVALAESACISGGSLTSSCATIASNWAVLSWSAESATNGTLLPPSANYQTFLVQLSSPMLITTHENTPEPRFYGVMGLGMFGLFFGAWRRKRKARNHSAAA